MKFNGKVRKKHEWKSVIESTYLVTSLFLSIYLFISIYIFLSIYLSIYLSRLQDGLFVLQYVDYIILEIVSCGASTVKARVLQILNLRGGTLKTVRDVVRSDLIYLPQCYGSGSGQQNKNHQNYKNIILINHLVF